MRWAFNWGSTPASQVHRLLRSWHVTSPCACQATSAALQGSAAFARPWSSTTTTQQGTGGPKAQAVQGSGGVFGSLKLAATFAAGMATLGAFYLSTRPEEAPHRPTPAVEPQQGGDPLLQVVNELSSTPDSTTTAPQEDVPAPAASTQAQSTTAPLAGPWVTDVDLANALQRRALSENRLRGYLHIKQRQVQQWIDQAQMMGRMTKEQFEKEMIAVEDEVNLQTNLILYGINDPHARRDYLQQYGCTKWTEQALKTISGYGPIIEIGAGLGHWQKQLSDRGVDVLAVDDMSALPVHDVKVTNPEFVGQVIKGDERVVGQHPRRTLLIVYPGPTSMALKALKQYKGSTLLYVGESRAGVNATDDFFDALGKDWELVTTAPVEPFPEGYEKLWVLKRKGRKGWLW